MESLPVWKLSAYVATPLVAALCLRALVEPRQVDAAPLLFRSSLQFRMDMAIFTLAALAGAVLLWLVAGFPFVGSGLKLSLAIFTMGLFASLDLALARERRVIHSARSMRGARRPPRRMVPLTHRFTAVAVAVIVLTAIVLLLVFVRDINWVAAQPASPDTFARLTRSVLIEVVFVMGVLLLLTLNLIISSSRNLRLLFDNETEVLERVSDGDFSRLAAVATNDELGFIAGHTNSMIVRLRDSLRMRKGLEIAREVQLNFLPEPPRIQGLDIAGSSLYSDETGGDFYDYMKSGDRTAMVVGDVVGHGVAAALLMTSCRAYLRLAADNDALGAGGIMQAANRQLALDVHGTGRFVTAFLLLAGPDGDFQWCGAGHPSALIYTPATDEFSSLKSMDIPLGVDAAWRYHTERLEPSLHERYLLLLSDGVTEASNGGDMFGEKRLRDAIREHATDDAADMMRGIFRAVGRFCPKPDDDITLVVVRMAGQG